MKATRVCLAIVVGLLTGAQLAGVGELSNGPPRAGMTCEPGARNCEAPERLGETVPRTTSAENHPCDWVETCLVPCGREGGECCHAEWNCPPDANLPRC